MNYGLFIFLFLAIISVVVLAQMELLKGNSTLIISAVVTTVVILYNSHKDREEREKIDIKNRKMSHKNALLRDKSIFFAEVVKLLSLLAIQNEHYKNYAFDEFNSVLADLRSLNSPIFIHCSVDTISQWLYLLDNAGNIATASRFIALESLFKSLRKDFGYDDKDLEDDDLIYLLSQGNINLCMAFPNHRSVI